MVEINNQTGRSSICWRGRRELDNGRQKTRNHGYDVIKGRAIYWLPDHPQTCHAKPKTKSTGWTLPASFPLVGCLPQAVWPERLSQCRRCGTAAKIKERGALLYDWSWWYPSGNRPLQQYLGFTAGRWLWLSEHKADSLIAKFKAAGGTVREIGWLSRVTAIISALVICIIVCLSWGC